MFKHTIRHIHDDHLGFAGGESEMLNGLSLGNHFLNSMFETYNEFEKEKFYKEKI